MRAVIRVPSSGPDSGCISGNMAVSRDVAVFGLTESTPAGSLESSHLLKVDLTAPGSMPELLVTLSPSDIGQSGLRDLFLGAAFDGAFVTPRGDVLRVEADGSWRSLTDSTFRSPVMDSAAHDTSFVRHGYPDWMISAATGDQSLEPFIDGGDAFDAVYLRTDGVDMVWAQLYDREVPGRYGRTEIWTAPFTTDPSTLSPRQVVVLPDTTDNAGNLTFGHGHVFSELDAYSIDVYTLAGSLLGTIYPPTNASLRGESVIFAAPGEFGYVPTWSVRPWVGQHQPLRIQRYDGLTAE